MKILIIDDNRDVRRILCEILESEAYTVVVAGDGDEGFGKIQTEQPDLVITDILMPGMDGFKLLREIRKDGRLKHIPVIFYTGIYLDKKDEDLAFEMGVSRYLIKPLAPADILRTVGEVLEEKLKPGISARRPEIMEEPVFLKRYNERLVNKLKNSVVESSRARLFLNHIIEGMGDGVIVIDQEYTIVQVNFALAASLGREPAELVGKKCFEMLHGQSAPCDSLHTLCPRQAVMERGETLKVLHTHLDAKGNEKYVEITASPVKDERLNMLYLVETHRDLMDKKVDDELVKLVKKLNETQVRLKQMTITDELTGIRNRRYIVERLEEEFQRARRSSRLLSLIMLDIDHFKRINDAYGHLFGDIVLKTITARIKATLRKQDLFGRVGGEEFLVICPESGLSETVIVARRIRDIVHGELIGDSVINVTVTLSAGVATLNENDNRADALFSRADAALYKAKDEGRDRVASL